MSGQVKLTVPADPPPLTEHATATAPKPWVSAKHGIIGLVLGIVAVAALVVGIVVLGRDGNSRSLQPERPAGAEAEAIQRDSFEYPPVSKFVATSDFWLNFVAPVSARPASACFLPAFKHSRAPLLLFHPHSQIAQFPSMHPL